MQGRFILMETTKIKYEGKYKKAGSKIFNTEIELLIKERKKLLNKTKYFLMEKIGNKYIYLSSLFEQDKENTYLFDDRKNNYIMRIIGTEIIIELEKVEKG